jgi:hypothetical protein
MNQGMRDIGVAPSWAPAALFNYALRVLFSPLVWTLSMIGYFGSYISVPSWADYSLCTWSWPYSDDLSWMKRSLRGAGLALPSRA